MYNKNYFVELETIHNGEEQLKQCLEEEKKAEYIKSYAIKFIEHERQIPKQLALWLISNELIDPAQGLIVCKGFATDDGDFVEVLPEDLDALYADDDYNEFEIWLKKEHTTHD
jgi:hypothetical protein